MKKLFGDIYVSDYAHGWKLVGSGILSCSPTGYHKVFKLIRGRVYRLIDEYRR